MTFLPKGCVWEIGTFTVPETVPRGRSQGVSSADAVAVTMGVRTQNRTMRSCVGRANTRRCRVRGFRLLVRRSDMSNSGSCWFGGGVGRLASQRPPHHARRRRSRRSSRLPGGSSEITALHRKGSRFIPVHTQVRSPRFARSPADDKVGFISQKMGLADIFKHAASIGLGTALRSGQHLARYQVAVETFGLH